MGKNKEIHRSAAMFFLKEPEDRLRDVIKYLQLAVISYNEYDQVMTSSKILDLAKKFF